jgi:hypothetical protein
MSVRGLQVTFYNLIQQMQNKLLSSAVTAFDSDGFSLGSDARW